MDVLRQGLLGSKIYLLHVVEFQTHAHLALCVEPQPQSTDEVDQVISAQVPPVSDNSKNQRYRELVLRHMVHRHTRACLNDNGLCKNFQSHSWRGHKLMIGAMFTTGDAWKKTE